MTARQIIRVKIPKYDPRIELIEELKLITKIGCMCPDFVNRKIKKIGDNADAKYVAIPCKHLEKTVNLLIQSGFKLKCPDLTGEVRPSVNLKIQLLQRAKCKCESLDCKNEILLEIHRIIRGSNGGLYSMNNCLVLCNKHHKDRHAGEF
jgi:hypothetical protein